MYLAYVPKDDPVELNSRIHTIYQKFFHNLLFTPQDYSMEHVFKNCFLGPDHSIYIMDVCTTLSNKIKSKTF